MNDDNVIMTNLTHKFNHIPTITQSDNIKIFTFVSPNPINPNNLNNYIFQTNMPHGQSSKMDTKVRKKKQSRKIIYGKGFESERLRMLPHFNQPYKHIEMFIRLGMPSKSKINFLGQKYNEHFEKEIKELNYPLFGRDQKRNKTLAIWFFEDNKYIIIPWLREIGVIE